MSSSFVNLLMIFPEQMLMTCGRHMILQSLTSKGCRVQWWALWLSDTPRLNLPAIYAHFPSFSASFISDFTSYFDDFIPYSTPTFFRPRPIHAALTLTCTSVLQSALVRALARNTADYVRRCWVPLLLYFTTHTRSHSLSYTTYTRSSQYTYGRHVIVFQTEWSSLGTSHTVDFHFGLPISTSHLASLNNNLVPLRSQFTASEFWVISTSVHLRAFWNLLFALTLYRLTQDIACLTRCYPCSLCCILTAFSFRS
jgi:hypothetical protein